MPVPKHTSPSKAQNGFCLHIRNQNFVLADFSHQNRQNRLPKEQAPTNRAQNAQKTSIKEEINATATKKLPATRRKKPPKTDFAQQQGTTSSKTAASNDCRPFATCLGFHEIGLESFAGKV